MHKAATEDVKRLYECYPYPYGDADTEPDFLLVYLFRSLFSLDTLAGWRILDAGCGTGHKLVGLALNYPDARFVGLELSATSVAVGQALLRKHRASNVELRQGDILTLASVEERFDVVQALGVVHHLENPQQGVDNLCTVLAPNGVVSIWLYHPLGEFARLNQRELLLTLWGGDWQAMAAGQQLMEQLGFTLERQHYGPRDRDANVLAGNADAYMHPIVNAYRFADAIDMFRLAGMDWVAVDFVNLQGRVKLINLGEIHDPLMAPHCVHAAELFASPPVRERYRNLSAVDQLKAIELSVRPRGFQIVGGKGESHQRLSRRLQGNVIALASD